MGSQDETGHPPGADPTEPPAGAPSRHRWVIYVDMDAYYVACELRERPDLVGQPVIVGPDPKRGPTRGVVLSASYEARAFGVRSALPAAQAARLCPQATWIAADFSKYGKASQEIREYLERYSDQVYPQSIDEAAAEVETENVAEVELLARRIQEGLRQELKLPASIGVATHRTVAKIACDRAKPGGIRVVEDAEVQAFLAPLPVGSIPGVGPKTSERLQALGVDRIEQLLTAPRDRLRREMGGFADDLIALARGTPVVRRHSDEERGPRSRSMAATFAHDIGDPVALRHELAELVADLAHSLEKERVRFQTVVVALRWEDFNRSQKNRTLPASHEDAESLLRPAERLLDELLESEHLGAGRRVRTMSVGVERLSPVRQRQRRLSEEPEAGEGPVNTRDPVVETERR